MNNLISFKLKMLTVLTFCVFMTFSMLAYVLRMTEKCVDSVDETCVRVSKNPFLRDVHVLRNASAVSGQLMRPGERPTSERRWTTSKRRAFDWSDVVTRETSGSGSVNQAGQRRTEDVYERRREHLERICRRYFDPSDLEKLKKTKLNHVLIDERHKALYCYVPKVACTNWKRIFLLLTGKASNVSEVVNLPASHVHGKNLFKSLQNYSVADVVKMTGEYTKFIFVRHPFERLLSAYRNKLEQHYDSSKYFQARFGKFIVRKFRKNPTNASLVRGDDVTFGEFVSYLLSSDPRHYNEHWQRVTDLCHPCLIRYDFIGRYETLLEDSNHLLKRFGLGFEFPVLSKPSTTASILKRYYGRLESNTIYRLYKIYEMDFRLFDYDLFNSPSSYSGLPVR